MTRLVERAFSYGYLSPQALGAFLKEAVTAPRRLVRLLGAIFKAHKTERKRGLMVLAYFPKALALGHWCRKTGVDHIHGEFAGHPATTAMIAAEVAGVPYSFSAHANDIVVSQALLVEKAQKAAFVRSISRYNIAFLDRLEGFPTEKLELVRCGVARASLKGDGPAALGDGPLRILYVGSLIEKKGVQYLIDALAMLPTDLDWQLQIVGGGDLADDLAKRVHTHGLSDRVTFDGPQPAEVVARAFAKAHVVVVPSIVGEQGRIEGIPVVIMEALANARPVIASALSGIPELIEDGVTGRLVPPEDASAIANALQEIATDWQAAAAMGMRGRDRVAAEYVVEDNAGKLADLMKRAG
ncbi:glycosyltransferase family 4 protein [Marivita sp. S2033]|uniref:glycosyltransferase family 4 protein n=1 Tax=Marivita sp. S2033 TaxID=3373187 RepID=UPI00398299B8